MTKLHVVLGNQLFPIEYIKKIDVRSVFMREDLGLCTYEKHHKQKIIMFLSAMRSYRDELKKNKIDVQYQELSYNSDTYKDSLIDYLKKENIKSLTFWEIEDKWFRDKMLSIREYVDEIKEIRSPMFLTDKRDFTEMCPIRKSPRYKMTDFYINQRKKLNVLIKDGKPIGGKWTYDNENRKKIPKHVDPPVSISFKHTNNTKEVMSLVDKEFRNHYGDSNNFNYPTTRKQALDNLDHFINKKFEKFGDYEDSVDQRSHLWFHSNLSSSLNIGLITPQEIMNKISTLKNIPINSYEGFIRQIIGWREFMRCIYHHEGDAMKKRIFST